MKITIYHVDTFTNQLFSGNPAAVCILEKWLSDNILQKIAAENNLPATAFLVYENDKIFTRWFTPDYEIDLCGHGTLATGYVLFNILEPNHKSINIHHSSAGSLRISRNAEFISLKLPIKNLETYFSSVLIEALGRKPKEIYQHKNERVLVIFESEDDVKQLTPNIELLKQLEHRGIIVTARGKVVDFVSRVFYPKKMIYEDPVTGSSYCLLIPYWAKELNKTQLQAWQLSQRGGEVLCEMHENHIVLHGKARLYMQGTIFYD